MQGGGAAWNGSAHGVYFFSSLDCTVEGLRNIRMWHTKQTDTLYVLLYLKWITNKDLLYSTGYSAQCYVAAWVGGEFGGEWIHVYVWLSPLTVHLKLLQYCYLSIPNTK